MLTVMAPGFREVRQDQITLLADQSLSLNVSLELGTASESVEVHAEGAMADVAMATLRQVVDERRMVDLPLNGRNAASFTLLIAGAVSAPARARTRATPRRFPAPSRSLPTGRAPTRSAIRWTGRITLTSTPTSTSRSPFPTRYRNSAFKPATTVRSTDRMRAAWSTSSRSPEPTRCTAMSSDSSQQGTQCAQLLRRPSRRTETLAVRIHAGRSGDTAQNL